MAAQSTSPSGGPLPPALAPGDPASSYALSGLDNINYFNGNLNIHIPVATVGGRGTAGRTLVIPIQRRWSINATFGFDYFSYGPESTNAVSLTYPYTFGYLSVESSSSIPLACVATNGTTEFAPTAAGGGQILTWLVWHAPDSTQTVLVDTRFAGQPQSAGGTDCGPSYAPANRQKVFRSYDGSNLFFVANQDVMDGPVSPGVASGTLFLPDGTQYITDPLGFISKVKDRNGNQIGYSFTPTSTGYVYTAVDSAGRTENFNTTFDLANNTQDVVTWSGTGGVQRQLKVNYAPMDTALSSGEAVKTVACLFPELAGSSSTNFDPFVVSSIQLPDGTSYSFQYNSYGEPTQLTLPTGGKYVYRYSEAGNCTDTSGSSGAITWSNGATIYRRVQERDELADGSHISAKQIFTAAPIANIDPNQPGVGADTKVQVDFQDGAGNLLKREVHYYYGDPTSRNSVPANPVGYPAWTDGLEFQTEFWDGGGSPAKLQTRQSVMAQRLFAPSEHAWTQADGTAPPHDPRVCQVNTMLDSGGTAGVLFGYDALYNNETDRFEFDYGTAPTMAGASCYSGTAPGSYLRHTQTLYKTDSNYVSAGPNLVSLPVSRAVLDGSNRPASIERWAYDESALADAAGTVSHDDTGFGTGNTVRGNVTTHAVWLSESGTFPLETFVWDTTGSVTSHRDFNGNTKTFAYGGASNPSHVSPAATVSALGTALGTRTYTYDQDTLQIASLTDENGSVTAYSYENAAFTLDRLLRVARGAGTPLESWTSYSYPSPTTVSVTQSQNTKADAAIRVDTLYDGLGRQTAVNQYENATQYIQTTTAYDGLGRTQATTNPSRPGDGLGFATTYTYDGLGRAKSVQTADSATTAISYTGNQTTVTGPGTPAQVRQTVTDALGRLAQVTEDPSGLGYVTSYSYNSQAGVNSLLQMQTLQGAQARTFLYNSRGLLVSATNPENGTVTYGYDNNGNLASRALGSSVVSYTYGAADLPLGISYAGGASTPGVTYHYDTSVPNSNGRLTSVSSSAAVNSITGYDALGRIMGSTVSIGGASAYPFTYTWNLADGLVSTTYPSGRVVTNSYDAANRITGVAGGGKTYITGLTYAPHGGPLTHTFGNSLARTYTYNKRLQATEMTDRTPSVPNPLLDLQYFFGGSTVLNGDSAQNNGNPTQIGIGKQDPGGPVVSFTQSYGYDALNRVSSAFDTGGWSESFGYDRYGNMWLSGTAGGLPTQQQMATSQSAYSAATNRLVGGSYDGAAGNQTVLGTSQLTYDAENRVVGNVDSVTLNTTVYSYDGLGQRVSKSPGGGTATLYVHDAFGNLAAEYNPANTAPCTTCYLSWDHLGSTRVVTDGSSGLPVARHDYLPFGVEVPNGSAGRTGVAGVADGLSPKFTGADRDKETGLDFLQARYLGSGQGRLMSVDPDNAGLNLSDPQSFNGYSYVANRPVIAIDPEGTDPCDSFDVSCDVWDWGWFPTPPIFWPSDPTGSLQLPPNVIFPVQPSAGPGSSPIQTNQNGFPTLLVSWPPIIKGPTLSKPAVKRVTTPQVSPSPSLLRLLACLTAPSFNMGIRRSESPSPPSDPNLGNPPGAVYTTATPQISKREAAGAIIGNQGSVRAAGAAVAVDYGVSVAQCLAP